jgi:hypothetical protein
MPPVALPNSVAAMREPAMSVVRQPAVAVMRGQATVAVGGEPALEGTGPNGGKASTPRAK